MAYTDNPVRDEILYQMELEEENRHRSLLERLQQEYERAEREEIE